MFAYGGRAHSAHVRDSRRGHAAREQIQDVSFTCGQAHSVTGLGLDARALAERETACLVDGDESGLQPRDKLQLVIAEVVPGPVERPARPRTVPSITSSLSWAAEATERWVIKPSANRTEVQSGDFVPSNTFAFTIVVAAPKASSQGVLNNLNSRGREWSAPERAAPNCVGERGKLCLARHSAPDSGDNAGCDR